MLAQGKKTYEMICGVCHGVDGIGKPGQAPPLAGSEWVNAKGVQAARAHSIDRTRWRRSRSKAARLEYCPWPRWARRLSDSDLAAVLSYIRSSWGNKGEPVTADDVKAVRAAFGGHAQPISGEQELMTMPE